MALACLLVDVMAPLEDNVVLSTVALLGCDESNRAVAMLMDWRCSTLRVNCGKTRHTNLLPLPTSVGQAIVEYLRRARPDSNARQIFVRHAAPWGAPICASVVRALIRRAFFRRGIKAASMGTHILRRSAATHMLQNGASFKEIADVLGHRSLNTTKLYAKVNLPALAQVALPWPGGAR